MDMDDKADCGQGGSDKSAGDVIFWLSAATALVFGIIAMIGNGLVIKVANHKVQRKGVLSYLNCIVRSLAAADFFTGFISFPLLLIYRYMNDLSILDGQPVPFKRELIWLIPNVLTGSTCLHVFCLTWLRLWCVERPLNYRSLHKKVRKISLVMIWTTAITICLIPTILWKSGASYEAIAVAREFIRTGLHTVPLIAIVAMYLRMFYLVCLNDRASTDSIGESRSAVSKKATQITLTVVVFLLCSYIPYLSHWQIKVVEDEVLCDSNYYAHLFFCLMLFNSCVNPFIYAKHLPEFRKAVKSLITCEGLSENEHSSIASRR